MRLKWQVALLISNSACQVLTPEGGRDAAAAEAECGAELLHQFLQIKQNVRLMQDPTFLKLLSDYRQPAQYDTCSPGGRLHKPDS